jgi:hypothetical protein
MQMGRFRSLRTNQMTSALARVGNAFRVNNKDDAQTWRMPVLFTAGVFGFGGGCEIYDLSLLMYFFLRGKGPKVILLESYDWKIRDL